MRQKKKRKDEQTLDKDIKAHGDINNRGTKERCETVYKKLRLDTHTFMNLIQFIYLRNSPFENSK